MWETDVILWFVSIHNSVMDVVMTSASRLASAGFLWIMICIMICCFSKKNRRYAIIPIISLFIAWFLADIIIKPMVCRVRPFEELGLEILVSIPTTSSFPSGHTASSFAAAYSIYSINHKWGFASLLFATLVGISRVYLSVHWPTDVIAGAIIGMLVAYVVCRLASSKSDHSNGNLL